MSRPFIAVVPQTICDGDKVLLKGLVKEDATEFSINFVNGTSPYPDDIAYHFKTIVRESLIVENSKKNGDWMEELVKDWPGSDGRLNLRIPLKFSNYDNEANSESSSILGPGFALEFAFTNGNIYTYLVEDEQARNLISYYEYESDLSEINSVQVWGDVEKIQELTFRYS